MDDVAGRVDRIVVFGLQHGIAVEIDLDQARGRDLLVQHAVGIDEDVVLGLGHARGDVVVDEVGHAVERHQPVAGGQIDARLPFLGRHLLA